MPTKPLFLVQKQKQEGKQTKAQQKRSEGTTEHLVGSIILPSFLPSSSKSRLDLKMAEQKGEYLEQSSGLNNLDR
jgi:hypothetical protein